MAGTLSRTKQDNEKKSTQRETNTTNLSTLQVDHT